MSNDLKMVADEETVKAIKSIWSDLENNKVFRTKQAKRCPKVIKAFDVGR